MGAVLPGRRLCHSLGLFWALIQTHYYSNHTPSPPKLIWNMLSWAIGDPDLKLWKFQLKAGLSSYFCMYLNNHLNISWTGTGLEPEKRWSQLNSEWHWTEKYHGFVIISKCLKGEKKKKKKVVKFLKVLEGLPGCPVDSVWARGSWCLLKLLGTSPAGWPLHGMGIPALLNPELSWSHAAPSTWDTTLPATSGDRRMSPAVWTFRLLTSAKPLIAFCK